jgi:23S rRNA (adenine2503-C2)-methyltransferase
MTERPTFITDLSPAQLEELMVSLGEPAYRAKIILRWVYQKRAASFEAMSDLPKALRDKLTEKLRLSSVTEASARESKDGTVKALLMLWDGRTIEAALIPSAKGQFTVCVSSQVGCATGCPFCATGQQGFERNLGASEICDQVLYFARRLGDDGSISNIVFMGMGEPFANYLDVMTAVEHLNAPWGFGLGARNITISTSGHIGGIEKLSKEKYQVGLAVSLHATDNAVRNKLVPMNRKYPLEKLIPACAAYIEATGRRVTFEYALFAGINDSILQARELARLLHGLNYHVNLIAANPTPGCAYQPSSKAVLLAFEEELKRLKVPATLRKSYGGDIQAACGQLKSRGKQT